jgi:nucleoid-associated protein YgaU
VSDYDPTRPFASDEPDPSYDWDDEPPTPKLLWGRVIALAAVLILAFLLGRATAPDDSAEEVDDLQAQLEEAADRIEELETIVAQGATPTETETPPDDGETESPPPDDGGGDGGGGGGGDEEVKEYTVKTGDSYNSIAEDFFGDPSLGSCISEANPGDDTLLVGDTINIPMACEDEG